MHLTVKQGQSVIDEFKIARGPIHIGRRASNHICLSNPKISKEHAVIYETDDGKWMVEDLDSANKTYLNGKAIHKAEITTGDCIRITKFTIDVDIDTPVTLDEQISEQRTVDLPGDDEPTVLEAVVEKEAEEKLVSDELFSAQRGRALLARDAQIIARKPGADKPSPIRFPGERAVDFLQATDAISRAGSADNVLLALLEVFLKQFGAYQVWGALRSEVSGPMSCHAGRYRDGRSLGIDDLKLDEKLSEVVQRGEFLLFVFSRVPGQDDRTSIRSVLMGPVVSPSGCFGVVYVNNTFLDDHYNLGDLDYMMLLAMHAATVLEKL